MKIARPARAIAPQERYHPLAAVTVAVTTFRVPNTSPAYTIILRLHDARVVLACILPHAGMQ
jgi:hypothetical protein